MAYVPLISYLAYTAIHEFIIGNNRRFRNFGLMAAILFGALCITSFYVAWFYAYFVLALILIFVVAIGAKGRQELFVQIRRSFMSVSIVVMAGVCALLPFIWAYYPKSLEVGTRSYEGVVRNTIPLEDVLQVGGGNLLFGRFYKELLSYASPAYSPQHEYSYTGFALPIFFLFIFGVFEAVKKRQAIQNGLLISSIGIATVATWITALNIRGVSLWFIIFHAVPGAKALNMVAAFQIFLVFPVTLVSIWFLSRQNLRLSLALLVVGVLFLGELTTPYLKLDRNIELNRISGVTLPPKECKVFYVDGWRNQENIPGFSESINGHYAHNVTAMLIARK